MNGDIWSTFFVVLIMLAVLIGAYFTTRLLSGKTTRLMKNKYIHIIDRMIITKDKQIMLIEAGDEYLLIGVTNQTIGLIGKIDKDEIKKVPEKTQNTSKKEVFSKIGNFITNIKEAQNNLNNARMQGKKGQRPLKEDDILEKMARSVEKSKDRIRNQRDNNIDNEEPGQES